jgi:hypothetical protein
MPTLLAAALAALYLVVDPPSADLATQEYRAALFGAQGLALWDNGWYGGHHLPGYSLVFPPLGHAIGVRVTGALSAVAAAWLFARLVHGGPRAPGRLGALWFAAGTATLLVTGRLTFALGTALGLAALAVATGREARGRAAAGANLGRAARGEARGRAAAGANPGWAAAGGARPGQAGAGVTRPGRAAAGAALAALAAVASPVAGLFLALAAAAWWLARRGRAAAWVAVGALAPVAALAVAFPEGGEEPFAASAFWPALALTVAVGLALPRRARVSRAGCALYAAALIAAFVLETPMGGNATRLGALAGGPLLASALPRRRLVLLAPLVACLVYWQWYPPVRDWLRARDDPAVRASFYAPLLRRLEAERAGRGPFRVEIPFTANHWEARWVPPRFMLARGWQRQLDVARNPLFYDGRLTPGRLRRWLDDEAVAFVAVPDAELDPSSREEARLVTGGRVPGLREVWRDARWRLYEVAGAAPPASGPARVTALLTDEVRLIARAPGVVTLRVRFTPYWRLAEGRGCVERTPDDRTRLRLTAPGAVRLVTTFAPGRVAATGPRCT